MSLKIIRKCHTHLVIIKTSQTAANLLYTATVYKHCLIKFYVTCITGNNSTTTFHGSEVGSVPGTISDSIQERPGTQKYSGMTAWKLKIKYRLLNMQILVG
jgi:hypothetical protein